MLQKLPRSFTRATKLLRRNDPRVETLALTVASLKGQQLCDLFGTDKDAEYFKNHRNRNSSSSQNGHSGGNGHGQSNGTSISNSSSEPVPAAQILADALTGNTSCTALVLEQHGLQAVAAGTSFADFFFDVIFDTYVVCHVRIPGSSPEAQQNTADAELAWQCD